MSSADLSQLALELPPEERLELARRLVESVVAPTSINNGVTEGIRRIEDIASGRVRGLTEEEYRTALDEGPLPP
jgi:uncharacterized tellurite resistance protein B-like protein